MEESGLAARVERPNVVAALAVVSLVEELIIMPCVHGDSLNSLLSGALQHDDPIPIPIPISCAVMVAVLHGLNAAHEARSELGKALAIVQRRFRRTMSATEPTELPEWSTSASPKRSTLRV